MPRWQQCMSKQQGFTLMEALIGFLILSIGMLGIASLQAVSLKAGKSSVYGSVATMKVEEIFESMRTNAASLASYTGAGAFGDCASIACTKAELAAEEVYWWKKNLTAGLPSTGGVSDVTTTVVVVPPTAPSRLAVVTVTLSWQERSKTAAGSVTKLYTSVSSICTQVPC